MSSLSRVIKYGTIFTRIRDLMRAGVLKKEDRPLWYDIMKAFPPVDPPTLEREVPCEPITDILYPEDVIRAKFYNFYGTQYTVNLTNHASIVKSPCQRFITKYQELEKSWTGSEEELLEAVANALSQEGLQLRKKGEKRVSKVQRTEKVEEGPSISKDVMANIIKATLTDNKPQET